MMHRVVEYMELCAALGAAWGALWLTATFVTRGRG